MTPTAAALALGAQALGGAAWIFQVARTWRTRSANDLSWAMLAIAVACVSSFGISYALSGALYLSLGQLPTLCAILTPLVMRRRYGARPPASGARPPMRAPRRSRRCPRRPPRASHPAGRADDLIDHRCQGVTTMTQPQPPTGRSSLPATSTAFEVRPMSPAEMRQCPPLSASRFGHAEVDQIPPWIIQTIGANGGIMLGAFADGRLIGYRISFPARRLGRTVLHGFGLAVDAAWQNRGVATSLMLAHRAAALDAGYDTIYWTTASIASDNLYLYLTKLGACLTALHPEMYVAASDPQDPPNFPDEVEIEWRLGDYPPKRQPVQGATGLTRTHRSDDGIRTLHADHPSLPETFSEEAYLIELPWDRHALWQHDRRAATDWSRLMRDLYPALFAAGYVGTLVVSDRAERRSFVQFQRASS